MKEAISYARRRLESRQVTPRFEAFLEMYLENAGNCLEDPSLENKSKLSSFNILHSEAFLGQLPNVK